MCCYVQSPVRGSTCAAVELFLSRDKTARRKRQQAIYILREYYINICTQSIRKATIHARPTDEIRLVFLRFSEKRKQLTLAQVERSCIRNNLYVSQVPFLAKIGEPAAGRKSVTQSPLSNRGLTRPSHRALDISREISPQEFCREKAYATRGKGACLTPRRLLLPREDQTQFRRTIK